MVTKPTGPDAWTLDELAQKANERLAARGVDSKASLDKRYVESVTPRNLRRLVSEGLVDQPERRGREAYYGPRHLDQVVAARDLMARKVGSSAIKALREAEFGAERLQASAAAASSWAEAFSQNRAEKSEPSSSDALSFLEGLETLGARHSLSYGQPLASFSVDAEQKQKSPRDDPMATYFATMSPASALSGSQAQAYGSLMASSASVAASTGTAEQQPFAGLRVSATVSADAPDLTPEQLAQAARAVERAWEEAREIAKLRSGAAGKKNSI